MSNIVCFAIIPTLPVDRQRGVAPRTRVDYKIMKKLIIVSGLTTTGKSNLAYELAKKYNTQIITADQMQVLIASIQRCTRIGKYQVIGRR